MFGCSEKPAKGIPSKDMMVMSEKQEDERSGYQGMGRRDEGGKNRERRKSANDWNGKRHWG